MANSTMAKRLKFIHQGVLISVISIFVTVTLKSWLLPANPRPTSSEIKTEVKQLEQWQSVVQISLQAGDLQDFALGTFQNGRNPSHPGPPTGGGVAS